ncbi:MAG: OmpA family protein [Candidatus Rokubacteria bacterium]|nr:OmpA family protein [Candidatus Rokubacteria bacterium]
MSAARIVLVLPAAAMLISGCATKDWVNKIITKERVDAEERVGKVESRVDAEGRRLGEESKRVDALGVKVKSAEDVVEAARGVADGARERADGAYTRADAAHARAGETDERLTRLWSGRHQRSAVDSARVLFAFDRFDLDDRAQTALLPMIEELKKNPALGVVLEGHTDPRGPRHYNLELSRRRVEAVRRHLVANGVELWRIHQIGLGPIEAAGAANADKRRVTITLTLSE